IKLCTFSLKSSGAYFMSLFDRTSFYFETIIIIKKFEYEQTQVIAWRKIFIEQAEIVFAETVMQFFPDFRPLEALTTYHCCVDQINDRIINGHRSCFFGTDDLHIGINGSNTDGF